MEQKKPVVVYKPRSIGPTMSHILTAAMEPYISERRQMVWEKQVRERIQKDMQDGVQSNSDNNGGTEKSSQ